MRLRPEGSVLSVSPEPESASQGQEQLPLLNEPDGKSNVDHPVPEDSGSEVSFPVALLGLAQVRGLGREGLRILCDESGGDLGRWLEPTDSRVLATTLRKARTPRADQVAEEIGNRTKELVGTGAIAHAALTARGIELLGRGDLPTRLAEVQGGPRWLFVEGRIETLFSAPAAAIVGTRRSSPVGRAAAREVTAVAAANGYVVVSGLAEGIDATAHATALVLGAPNVAFLGHGHDIVFPASTKDIREDIVASGGVVASEYMPEERYGRATFVERNRLQAALATVVIPVEANVRGGTAHTVRFARKYNRPVVGVRWKGANGLLEELEAGGARVIDIEESDGLRDLDAVLAALAEEHGRRESSLHMTELALNWERKARAIREDDVQRVTRRLTET